MSTLEDDGNGEERTVGTGAMTHNVDQGERWRGLMNMLGDDGKGEEKTVGTDENGGEG
jgi:hypothetical protein